MRRFGRSKKKREMFKKVKNYEITILFCIYLFPSIFYLWHVAHIDKRDLKVITLANKYPVYRYKNI